MKKTYKLFMTENKKEMNISDVIKKVRKDLKGIKHVDSILKFLNLEGNDNEDDDNVDEASHALHNTLILGAYATVTIYIAKKIKKFWESVKQDMEDLLDAESASDHAVILGKLAAKACVVAVIVGVVADELIKLAKGDKPEEIDYGKVAEEMADISAGLK